MLLGVMPGFLLDTGVEALQGTHPDCFAAAPATDAATMENAKSSVPIDLKCWAYVSGAPFGPVPDINPVTQEVELSLEQGFKLSGKVNLFNFVKFDMIALIDVFSKSLSKRFMIDAEVQPIDFAGLVQVGKQIGSNGEAIGGARSVDVTWT